MRIIGCDLHARQQTHRSGRFNAHAHWAWKFGIKLSHAVAFVQQSCIHDLPGGGIQHRQRTAESRKQKHDRRDADLILKLLVENRFPAIWMPSPELRDLRALLLHRHQWVRMRTRIQNALQAIALANGLRRGSSLWSRDGRKAIASLPLAPHTAYRRSALQAMYVKIGAEIEELNRQVAEQTDHRSGARLLMTHPGVGPVTALATDVFLGDPKRFVDSKALASYVGMIPREHSSGERQPLGGLTKQGGSPLLRFLWGEAGAHAARRDPELQRFYRRKLVQKGLGKASVAVARKLGIRLWIMLRDEIDYHEFCRRGQKQQKSGEACAGMPETRYGANRHRPVD
jgi:transposase